MCTPVIFLNLHDSFWHVVYDKTEKGVWKLTDCMKTYNYTCIHVVLTNARIKVCEEIWDLLHCSLINTEFDLWHP